MGRLSRVDDADVFSALGELMATNGSVNLQEVVSRTGVSIGSLYHRYGSREELIARAWLDAVAAFHRQFLSALESGRPDAGERAAMATPRFCRSDAARARILVCCRKEDLLGSRTPPRLVAEITQVNTDVADRVAAFADARGLPPDACRLGLVAYPLGAVRLYLPKFDIPENLDAYVAAAYRSAANLTQDFPPGSGST